MKKKLSLILCLVIMVLGMTACGTDPADVDYFGMSYSELQGYMEQEVSALVALTDENKEYIANYGSEVSIKLVSSWEETTSELGAYQGLGDFSVSKTQDNVTVEQLLEFQEREAVVTYVYTYNYETKQPELTDASTDLVYTLSEKMAKAGLNTLMGMGTVFSVLILISLIIYCFRIIPYLQKKKESEKTVVSVETSAAAPVIQETEQLLTDDLELVAVISAAIAAGTGTSTDSFVVRSIHRR